MTMFRTKHFFTATDDGYVHNAERLLAHGAFFFRHLSSSSFFFLALQKTLLHLAAIRDADQLKAHDGE